MWSVTTLNWIGSAVLMGFVLNSIGNPLTPRHKIALLSIAVVGILLPLFVWGWTRQLRGVKVAKYERCKEIESKLGMTQHSSLSYPSGRQTWQYSVLMLSFLASWVVLLVVVLSE